MDNVLWEGLRSAAGGIDDDYRVQFEECFRKRREKVGEEFLRVSPPARNLVRLTIKGLVKQANRLASLENNRAVRCYNRMGCPEEIERQLEKDLAERRGDRAHVAIIIARLSADKRRLSRRSKKNFDDHRRAQFFMEILEIWAVALGVSIPLQASETAMSGRFLLFLELAVRATEPRLRESELKGRLKRALGIAIKLMDRRRR
jgi:hypothetical protein